MSFRYGTVMRGATAPIPLPIVFSAGGCGVCRTGNAPAPAEAGAGGTGGFVRSHRVSIIGAAAVLLALSGCSALGLGAPGAPATRTPSATPTPTAVALDCPSIVAETDLTTLLGAQAAVVTTPPDMVESVAAGGPLALPATGGAACRWKHGGDTLTVQLLPHAAEAWAHLAASFPDAATPGADYDGGVSLGGDCTLTPTVWCRTNVLVADAWLAVSLKAESAPGLTEAGFHDIVQRMLPAVGTAAATAPAPPSGTAIDCAADDVRAEVQRVFDRPAVTSMAVDLGFGLGSGVLLMPGTTLCPFQPDDGTGGYLGSLSVLPRAEAVYQQFRAAVLAQDSGAHSETITVKGEQLPALVWSGTVEGTAFASVDALVGSRWVQFHSTDLDDSRSLALVQWAAEKL